MKLRIVLTALAASSILAASGVCLESLLRLAYAHNALGAFWQDFSAWPLLGLRWPCLVLEKLDFSVATDFTHSHVQGEDFWIVVGSYLVVNSIGWAAFLSLFAFGASKLSRKLFRK